MSQSLLSCAAVGSQSCLLYLAPQVAFILYGAVKSPYGAHHMKRVKDSLAGRVHFTRQIIRQGRCVLKRDLQERFPPLASTTCL